jgi:hypothetical protein
MNTDKNQHQSASKEDFGCRLPALGMLKKFVTSNRFVCD